MATAEIPEGKLRLEIITPKGVALQTNVDEITAPGVQGEFGVLSGHLPLLAALRPGLVTYRVGADTKRCAVAGGFAEVEANRVVLLCPDFAQREAIDPVQVRKQLQDIDQEITQVEAEASTDEEANERLPGLVRRENWLAAQLELYGDPPPSALRPFEQFGPTPLPEDEDDQTPAPPAAGGAGGAS